jgi:hypothetical protein
MFLLWVSLDDMSFEEDQEQPFEEVKHQFLGEKGKWFSPSTYYILF